MGPNNSLKININVPPRVLVAFIAMAMILVFPRSISSTQDVRLSTYYPVPNGLYTQMLTSGPTYLAPRAGVGAMPNNYVEIGGTATELDPNASLVLARGGIGIETTNMQSPYANQGLGLYIGGGFSGGAPTQIQLDNSGGPSGFVSKNNDSLEFWAPDQVAFGVGPILPYSSRGDSMFVSNGNMTVNGGFQYSGNMSINGPMNLNGTGGNVAHNCQLVTGNTAQSCTAGVGWSGNPACAAWLGWYYGATVVNGWAWPCDLAQGIPSESFCQNGCKCVCSGSYCPVSGWGWINNTGWAGCAFPPLDCVPPEPPCCVTGPYISPQCQGILGVGWTFAGVSCPGGTFPVSGGGWCDNEYAPWEIGTGAFASFPSNEGNNYNCNGSVPVVGGTPNTGGPNSWTFGCANASGMAGGYGALLSAPYSTTAQAVCCQF